MQSQFKDTENILKLKSNESVSSEESASYYSQDSDSEKSPSIIEESKNQTEMERLNLTNNFSEKCSKNRDKMGTVNINSEFQILTF